MERGIYCSNRDVCGRGGEGLREEWTTSSVSTYNKGSGYRGVWDYKKRGKGRDRQKLKPSYYTQTLPYVSVHIKSIPSGCLGEVPW